MSILDSDVDQKADLDVDQKADLKAAWKALVYTPAECHAMYVSFLLTLAVMFSVLLLAARHQGLLWPAFLICLFCSIRVSGYVHALNHAYQTPGRVERVPWLLEMLPAGFTPLLLGFRETQRVHLLHHKLETRPGDPDNFLIAGNSRLFSIVKCAFTFEYWFFYMLRRGELSARFWPGFLLRVAIFAALGVLAGPRAFLIVWILGVKLGTGLSFFVFSYLAHIQHGQRGIFQLPLPPLLDRLNRLLIGDYAAQPANHHDIHHQRPWVSCTRLIEARLLQNRTCSAV